MNYYKKLTEHKSLEIDIEWDKKLESVGITELICNITKEKIPVNLIKELWYEENKQYL
jgi:hypothetical protein